MLEPQGLSDAARCGGGKRDLEAFGRVASEVVHDLRNLNNIVSLTVRNFQDHLEDPAFRQEAMHTLETTTRHMKGLIDKLFAGPTRTNLRREATTLGALVHHALDLLARAGRHAEVKATTVRGLDRPLLCEVDIEEMQRVVFNLLLNAYEAVEDRGKVSVAGYAVPELSQVCLVIEDTGPGISQAYLENCLFCAFRSTKPCGGGVGLYHAKAIIEAHGGAIRVVNRDDARGARVTVTLPAAREKSTASARTPKAQAHVPA